MVLLYKLKMLGFKSHSVKWFESYLCDRSQVTCVNGETSSSMSVKTGVPQGSILGPFLFCIYVNDLCTHLRRSTGYLYADDTALLVSGNDIMTISNSLNQELNNLSNWFAANKLSINISKTCSVLFRSRHKFHAENELLIIHESQEVQQVSHFKYLGVILDQHLDFKSHVDYIRGKVSQRTGLMWRIRNCISTQLAKDLYISLIDPYFQYFSFVYDGCQLNSKRCLQTRQNKVLRAVLQVGNRYSTNDLHKESGIEWLGITRAKNTCIETKLEQACFYMKRFLTNKK